MVLILKSYLCSVLVLRTVNPRTAFWKYEDSFVAQPQVTFRKQLLVLAEGYSFGGSLQVGAAVRLNQLTSRDIVHMRSL